jgi:hypothetical protein
MTPARKNGMTVRGVLVALTLALSVCHESPGIAQSLPAGSARSANGVLVVVRADGVENHLQGRRALQVFEGDTLRIEGKGEALVETREGVQAALTGNTVVKILSRWERGRGVTRILRVQRGEVWVRNADAQQRVEIETPMGVLAAAAAEVSVKLASSEEAVATVVQGTAEFSTPLSSCQLGAGTVSHGYRGKACTQPKVVDVQPIIGWSHPLLVR